jgi:hypothetical protein
MTEKSKVSSLKEALIDTLIDQIENGPVVVDKDSGEVMRVSAPASLLSVAAKVVKDFAHEAEVNKGITEKAEKLQTYLDRRQGIRAVT